MKRRLDTIPAPKQSPVSPRILGLAICAAYPFTTASGTAARKRPGNGKGPDAPRSRGRYCREAT